MRRPALPRLLYLLALAGVLSACDTNDGTGAGVSAYFGTYTGTLSGTASAGGFPLPLTLPGTVTFAKTGMGTASLAVSGGGNTTSLVGTYDADGMTFESEQGARVEVDRSGRIVGTLALPIGTVAATLTASGTVTARRLTLQMATPAGSPVAATLAFDGTR